MAVSKRLRFEILRRDNYTCHYCGASAPDAKLTVDHVIPVSTGGPDTPENLVAACRDCNAGKSSSTPDAALVAEVGTAARAYMLALQDGFTRLRGQYEAEAEYIDDFTEAWGRWGYDDPKEGRKELPLPSGWTLSLRRWYRIGVPIGLIKESIEIAMTRTKLSNAELSARFSYMAGCVWRKVDELGSIETVTPDSVAVYTEMEADEMASDMAMTAYQQGFHFALQKYGIELGGPGENS